MAIFANPPSLENVDVNELQIGFLGTISLLIPVVYSWLQMLGGRDINYLGIRARIWGRLIAPLFLSGAVCLLALFLGKFHWHYLASLLAYPVSTTLGYGGNNLWVKLSRRTLWALVRVSCSLIFAVTAGAWTLWISQLLIALWAANLLGIKNVLKAPQEEMLINFSTVFLVPFMIL